eukprot:14389978-Alexandrium_andersonii.AAC.1
MARPAGRMFSHTRWRSGRHAHSAEGRWLPSFLPGGAFAHYPAVRQAGETRQGVAAGLVQILWEVREAWAGRLSSV